jgi:hypothetical protein
MPRDAKAEDHVEFSGIKEGAHAMMIGLSGSVDALGLFFTIGNLKGIVAEEKPCTAGRIGGWITGALNIGFGVFLLCVGYDDDLAVGLGIGNIVVGGFDIGMAEWAATYHRKTHVSLSPMMSKDSEGNPAFGFGVRVIGW